MSEVRKEMKKLKITHVAFASKQNNQTTIWATAVQYRENDITVVEIGAKKIIVEEY